MSDVNFGRVAGSVLVFAGMSVICRLRTPTLSANATSEAGNQIGVNGRVVALGDKVGPLIVKKSISAW